MQFIDGQFRGEGEIRLPEYHILKDLQSHHIDCVYPGLVISKKLSDILVQHLKTRHSIDLSFSDRISQKEWEELIHSVDLDGFESTRPKPVIRAKRGQRPNRRHGAGASLPTPRSGR